MLQNDHHECACATSLTFTFTAVVIEEFPQVAVECMVQRKIRLVHL